MESDQGSRGFLPKWLLAMLKSDKRKRTGRASWQRRRAGHKEKVIAKRRAKNKVARWTRRMQRLQRQGKKHTVSKCG